MYLVDHVTFGSRQFVNIRRKIVFAVRVKWLDVPPRIVCRINAEWVFSALQWPAGRCHLSLICWFCSLDIRLLRLAAAMWQERQEKVCVSNFSISQQSLVYRPTVWTASAAAVTAGKMYNTVHYFRLIMRHALLLMPKIHYTCFPVDGEAANLLRTCYRETGVVDFGLNV